jgi:hypothetical protein
MIHKLILETTNTQKFAIPRGSYILSVRVQGTNIVVYYQFDSDYEQKPIDFFFYGTGNDMPRVEVAGRYLGTVDDPINIGLVWHIFYKY